MAETFGSTCHGAGRAQSRNRSRNNLSYEDVLASLASTSAQLPSLPGLRRDWGRPCHIRAGTGNTAADICGVIGLDGSLLGPHHLRRDSPLPTAAV